MPGQVIRLSDEVPAGSVSDAQIQDPDRRLPARTMAPLELEPMARHTVTVGQAMWLREDVPEGSASDVHVQLPDV